MSPAVPADRHPRSVALLEMAGKGLAMIALWGLFVTFSLGNRDHPRRILSPEIEVTLPLFVQVLGFAGDRYLAANIAAIRALVVETSKMTPDQYPVLGRVQEDVAWLNPAHEDNYYTAAAILPWNGELEAAQNVLAKAAAVRYFDYQPAFYYAFHRLHYYQDPVGASEALLRAAERMPEGDERLQMQNLAAIWVSRSQDLQIAIRVVEGMAQQAKRRDFQAYLRKRITRLQGLKDLRSAQELYVQRYQRPLPRLRDLVTFGLLEKLPDDPLEFGYEIDAAGQIVLRTSKPKESNEK
ncbi:MAG: hypothetical protein IPH08_06710 [Rhodocyclaceae bacterium]|jgi:hypothetical protein|nr:hypothetical protein [Rhodocyclaceae bacterium]MBK6906772.1 hypothetical protein [Rhodocyclaceae bacterium]